ncbi:MAG TPA: metallophosphoesterase, partial [Abditibacteriaceae bacterium]
FSFVVWGDSGTGSRGQKTLASRIQAQRPDFLLHSGDLVYPRGSVADFDPKFFSLYKPTVARVPFYGALGNHDIGTRNGQPFLDNFVFPRNGPRGVQPERHFSFDYGNAHIVVIDSNASERQLREVVAPWIRADAAKTKALWKFAVFHHPPFSSGLHGDEPRTLRALVPTFARLKFDIVFNGHDHHFERFAPKSGVRYVVTGAGGAPLYPRRDQNPKTHAFRNDVYSLTRIDISGRTLRGRQISSDGAILDDWKITK